MLQPIEKILSHFYFVFLRQSVWTGKRKIRAEKICATLPRQRYNGVCPLVYFISEGKIYLSLPSHWIPRQPKQKAYISIHLLNLRPTDPLTQ